MAIQARLLLGGGILWAALAPVHAQAPARPTTSPPAASQPPPVSADPQATTAAYGDWMLRCQRAGDGAQAVRICEVIQTIQAQGQGPLAQVAVGRVEPKEPLKITVVVPHNVAFTVGVRLAINEKDAQPIDLVWRRCLPLGCMADFELKEETLRRWRVQSANGRLTFRDAADREVALPWSFRGFAQALDALAKS